VLAEMDNLVRCRSAIQYGVVKGKPPEVANHLAMRFGITQKTGVVSGSWWKKGKASSSSEFAQVRLALAWQASKEG